MEIIDMIMNILTDTKPWQEMVFIGWWLIAYKQIKGDQGIKVFAAGFLTSMLYAILSSVMILRDFGMLLGFSSLIVGLFLIISKNKKE